TSGSGSSYKWIRFLQVLEVEPGRLQETGGDDTGHGYRRANQRSNVKANREIAVETGSAAEDHACDGAGGIRPLPEEPCRNRPDGTRDECAGEIEKFGEGRKPGCAEDPRDHAQARDDP